MHLIVLGSLLNLSPYAKVRFNDNKLILSLGRIFMVRRDRVWKRLSALVTDI